MKGDSTEKTNRGGRGGRREQEFPDKNSAAKKGFFRRLNGMGEKTMLKRWGMTAGLLALTVAALLGRQQEAAGRPMEDTFVYLPLVVKSPPELALEAPSLSCGSNAWTMAWNDGGTAVSAYLLEEAHEPAFTAPVPYMTTATTQALNHPPSTDNLYYYRVRADGNWGAGPWSETQLVVGGFLDTFTDAGSGWPVADDAQGSAAYAGGAYLVGAKQAGYLIAALAPDVARNGYRAAVDVQWAAGSATDGLYALVFGAAADLNRYYFLAVRPSAQSYRVYFFDGSLPAADRLRPLTAWTPSAAIHGGAQMNHLEVTRVGDGIQAAVNGTAVGSWTDAAQTGATFSGVVVSSNPANPAAAASFDNFSLGACGTILAQTALEVNRTAVQIGPGISVDAIDMGW